MTLTQKRLLLITLCSLLLPATAYAQVTTADLVGTVRDTSGAIMPGVTVVLTNEATGSAAPSPPVRRAHTSSRPCSRAATGSTPNPGFRKVERTASIAGQSTRRDRPGARGRLDQRP